MTVIGVLLAEGTSHQGAEHGCTSQGSHVGSSVLLL